MFLQNRLKKYLKKEKSYQNRVIILYNSIIKQYNDIIKFQQINSYTFAFKKFLKNVMKY